MFKNIVYINYNNICFFQFYALCKHFQLYILNNLEIVWFSKKGAWENRILTWNWIGNEKKYDFSEEWLWPTHNFLVSAHFLHKCFYFIKNIIKFQTKSENCFKLYYFTCFPLVKRLSDVNNLIIKKFF